MQVLSEISLQILGQEPLLHARKIYTFYRKTTNLTLEDWYDFVCFQVTGKPNSFMRSASATYSPKHDTKQKLNEENNLK